MFRSIRWRLVASYVLLTLISVSIVGVLATEIVRLNVQEQEVNELRANAGTLAQQLYPLLRVQSDSLQIHSLTQAASFLGDVRVRVLDDSGQVLADSGQPSLLEELVLIYPHSEADNFSFPNEAWFNLIMPVVEQPHFEFDAAMIENFPSGTSFQFVQRSTGPWGGRISFEMPDIRATALPTQIASSAFDLARSARVIKEPIGNSQNPLGFVEVSAGQDFGTATLVTTRRAFLLAGVGATLLAVVFGLVMSHRLTSPIRSLQKTAQRMGSGDFTARAQYQGADEIGDLSTQFNQMADQLQANFAQVENERDTLRRFISDASHELRTPVAALKNFLTLLQGPAADDQPAQAEFLSESQIQIDRLEWITSNLLDLTRMDAGLVEFEYDNHDLGELITNAAAPFKSGAESKGISLEIHLPASTLMLWCDAHRMEIVLTNLLDNALKFTLPGGVITIAAEETSQEIKIRVADTGTGIRPDELPYVFDRFYRGRTHTGGGSGLGLAIAKSLVESQGGQIAAKSVFGEGSEFIITFQKSR
ncbi:MAG: HAMP domain-containing histidine kinase [Chloroflexota bacterium]|nr:MAG: HAMP domain-containing histidine kinase [Chloroflexota bacterium]